MEQKKIVLFILIVHLAAFLAGCSGNKIAETMTPLIYGISYRATSARPQNTKMYMGIFALLYYIIMGIQSEPLKTGKDDELKSRTDG